MVFSRLSLKDGPTFTRHPRRYAGDWLPAIKMLAYGVSRVASPRVAIP